MRGVSREKTLSGVYTVSVKEMIRNPERWKRTQRDERRKSVERSDFQHKRRPFASAFNLSHSFHVIC